MKIIKPTGLIVAAALMTFACSKPADTVETTDAQEVASSEGTTLTLSPEASKIAWMGYKPTGQHHGVIPATTGTVTVNGTEVTGGSFTFDITALEIHDMEAGTEMHGKLSTHLQSDDFFDAANHPTATFEITAVEPFTADDVVADNEEFASDNTPKTNSEDEATAVDKAKDKFVYNSVGLVLDVKAN